MLSDTLVLLCLSLFAKTVPVNQCIKVTPERNQPKRGSNAMATFLSPFPCNRCVRPIPCCRPREHYSKSDRTCPPLISLSPTPLALVVSQVTIPRSLPREFCPTPVADGLVGRSRLLPLVSQQVGEGGKVSAIAPVFPTLRFLGLFQDDGIGVRRAGPTRPARVSTAPVRRLRA